MKRWLLAGVAGTLLAMPCCARLRVEPIEIKPIHITMDINIKIQKQLDEDLAFEDAFETVDSSSDNKK